MTSTLTQIHGHRNSFMTRPLQYPRSINLEQGVEFGGFLGTVIIDKEGVRDVSIRNMDFPDGVVPRDEKSLPLTFQWQMKAHKGIEHKEMPGGITAYNFTRETFFSGTYDDLTARARGLFMDRTDHVVARGFEKFFAIGERDREDMQLDVIRERVDGNLLSVDEKLNGFLALASWSPTLKDVFITSKGGGEKYSELARNIIVDSLPADYKKWFKYHEDVTVVFEVIDPVNDPHIVEYNEPQAVLIDVLNNDLNGLRNHEVWEEILETGFIDANSIVPRDLVDKFDDVETAFEVEEMIHQEGLVVTDLTDGFKFKWKTPYYLTFKEIRNKLGALVVRDQNRWQKNALVALDKMTFYNPKTRQILEHWLEQDTPNIERTPEGKPDMPRTIKENGLDKYYEEI